MSASFFPHVKLWGNDALPKRRPVVLHVFTIPSLTNTFTAWERTQWQSLMNRVPACSEALLSPRSSESHLNACA